MRPNLVVPMRKKKKHTQQKLYFIFRSICTRLAVVHVFRTNPCRFLFPRINGPDCTTDVRERPGKTLNVKRIVDIVVLQGFLPLL